MAFRVFVSACVGVYLPVWAFCSCDPSRLVLVCWNDKQCSRGWNNEGPSEGLISPAQVHPRSGIASSVGGWGIKVIRHLILQPSWVFLLTSYLPGGLVLSVRVAVRSVFLPRFPLKWGQFSQR